MKCPEFEDRDVSFGALHFAAIDMRGLARLNPRMQHVLGSGSNIAGNHCVLKHVAMGLEWMADENHIRIPPKESRRPAS